MNSGSCLFRKAVQTDPDVCSGVYFCFISLLDVVSLFSSGNIFCSKPRMSFRCWVYCLCVLFYTYFKHYINDLLWR